MIDVFNQVISLSGVGIVVFAVTFWLMVKISPFLLKEIEETKTLHLRFYTINVYRSGYFDKRGHKLECG